MHGMHSMLGDAIPSLRMTSLGSTPVASSPLMTELSSGVPSSAKPIRGMIIGSESEDVEGRWCGNSGLPLGSADAEPVAARFFFSCLRSSRVDKPRETGAREEVL